MWKIRHVSETTEPHGILDTLDLQDRWAGGSACPAGVQQYGHIACTPLTRQSICVDSIVRYCQLGRRMQRFLQFWLGCHGLPNAAGRLAGAGHVDRANRVCLTCNSGAIGDEKHMIFECTALSLLKQQHAGLFTPRTSTMRSFFAQQYHLLRC